MRLAANGRAEADAEAAAEETEAEAEVVTELDTSRVDHLTSSDCLGEQPDDPL